MGLIHPNSRLDTLQTFVGPINSGGVSSPHPETETVSLKSKGFPRRRSRAERAIASNRHVEAERDNDCFHRQTGRLWSGSLKRASTWLARVGAERATMAQLARMSDVELHDIGLV